MNKLSSINSTKKNNFTKKTNNKGFTLVELLATIAVLSIVLTIVIYFAVNIVNNAKEKSYSVTINNIQNTASSYVMEGKSVMPWIDGVNNSYQYQCITVQHLLDAGYFKGDILDSYVDDDVKVRATDYIYLERAKEIKTITKNILLVNEMSSYSNGLCGNISTTGNITFVVEPTGWSKEKVITIKYDIHNNIDKASNYKYDYVYGEDNLNKKFINLSMVEELTVDSNDTLFATIKDVENNLVASNSLVISKVDNELPVASIESTNNVASYQTATLNISDNAGVSAYYFGKENPEVTEVDWISVDGNTDIQKSAKVDSNGIWYLGVKDVVGNTAIISKEFYKTTLSVNHATVTPSTVITMSGNTFPLPDVIEDEFYTFNGWYTTESCEIKVGDVDNIYKPTGNSTLYGKTTENKLTGGVVVIKGTNTYGETLTATITEDTTPIADEYEYQWYYNSSNSTSGGTAIDGATGSTYKPNSKSYDKYVYVVVTAIKDNYRSTTFSDITDASTNTTPKVVKRKITVTAISKNKTYDGSALTDSTCTLTSGTMAFSQTITSCTMTSGSTITNVGNVDNVIDSVTMTSGKGYYDITYESGTLTVTKKSLSLGNYSAAYNGTTEYSKTFSTGVGSETLALTYKPYSKNVGSYTYATSAASGKYIVTAANGTGKASNYSIGSGGTFTINKVSATCPTITSYEGTYDGKQHGVTLIGGTGGTIKYRTSTTGTWSTTKPTSSVVSTSTVYVQVTGDSNHNDVDCGSGTITINKKSLTPSVSASNKTYNGTTSATCSVTLSGIVSGDTVSASATGAFDNKNVGTGKTVTCSSITLAGTDAGNYSLSTTSATTTANITARAITITAKDQTVTYGTAITKTTAQVTIGGSGLASGDSLTSITLTQSTTNYTTNGTITPSAVVIKDSNGSAMTSNYSITYVKGVLKINKKAVTIPVASAYCKSSLTYTGSIQTLTNAAGTGYTFSNNTGTNAGSYTVTATLNSNYKWEDDTTGTKTFSCSIGKATPTMTVTPSTLSLDLPNTGTITYTYNGDGSVSCSSTNTAVATCSIDTSTKKVTVNSLTEGSTTIKISAAAGNNYNSTSKSVTVTVVNPVVTINAARYSCPVYSDYQRTSIYNITTCTGGICNFDRLNGFSNSYTGFSKDVNYPISWTVSQDILRSEFGDTMYNDCGGKKMYINATTMNCRSAPDMDNSTVLKTFNACVRVKAVRTTHKVSSSYDWFYSTTYGCFMTGRYLTTSTPSSCSGGSSDDTDTGTNTGTGSNSCLSGWITLADDSGATYCCPKGVSDPHNVPEGYHCLYIGG